VTATAPPSDRLLHTRTAGMCSHICMSTRACVRARAHTHDAQERQQGRPASTDAAALERPQTCSSRSCTLEPYLGSSDLQKVPAEVAPLVKRHRVCLAGVRCAAAAAAGKRSPRHRPCDDRVIEQRIRHVAQAIGLRRRSLVAGRVAGPEKVHDAVPARQRRRGKPQVRPHARAAEAHVVCVLLLSVLSARRARPSPEHDPLREPGLRAPLPQPSHQDVAEWVEREISRVRGVGGA